MRFSRKYLNLYIIAVIIMIAIFLSAVIPSNELEVEGSNITLVPSTKQLTAESIITSPIDSLIGIDDGDTIKASNTGVSNGAINLVLLVLAIGSFVSICSKLGVFEQLINMIITSNLSIYHVTTLLAIYFIASSVTYGLYETAVCYIPLTISLYKRYNVSPLYAIKLIVLSLSVGYIASPINPFATLVADQAANNTSEMFMFRTFLLVTISIAVIIYFLISLKKQEPKMISASEVARGDINYLNILMFLIPYIYMTIGFIPNLWFSATNASVTIIFLLCGIIIGLVNKYSLEKTIDALLIGASNFMVVALSITLARTVYILLYNNHVVDTIIYSIVDVSMQLNVIIVIITIGLIFLILGYVVPSPSALSMLTLPIIAPAMALVGISPAIVVSIFLLMHGINKMGSITSPLVIAAMTEAEVSYYEYVWSIAKVVIAIAAINFVMIFMFL